MAATKRSRLDRDALAWCRDERDRALETLRLIEERMVAKGRKPAGLPPIRGDREKLERAAEILAALVGGRRR